MKKNKKKPYASAEPVFQKAMKNPGMALKGALRNLRVKQLEEKHRQGYLAHPPSREEVAVWEKEQEWGIK